MDDFPELFGEEEKVSCNMKPLEGKILNDDDHNDVTLGCTESNSLLGNALKSTDQL